MDVTRKLPIAVIGAGPIGLAAAAHLIERGLTVKVYEAGASVGANVRDWRHVRIFTTWEQSVDAASCRLLERYGWNLPSAHKLPTGGELYDRYLKPLAETPEMSRVIATHARVLSITRRGIDKVTSRNRDMKPFELRVAAMDEAVRTEFAQAVIDASGTWQHQNPAGASGTPAQGETLHMEQIAYGMPDVLAADRSVYAGKRIAVIGSGYSAINVILDLAKLAESARDTTVTWVVRGTNMAKIYGGGANDQLEARGALGTSLKQLVEQGRIKFVMGFATTTIRQDGEGIALVGLRDGHETVLPGVDRLIVCTGQRPNLEMTRELRLELDPWLESVKALGPLIDPNEHSCGSVPPHGHRALSHPEPGFYTIGVKSYGRAPTFLLLTGYEQARSVAAVLAGDLEAADKVELVLPETGICSTDFTTDAAACCGGEAPATIDACCVADAVAKEEGRKGCGCGDAA